MAEAGVPQDPGAVDELLGWNGVVHVFPRENISTRSNLKYLWVFPAVLFHVTAYVTALYMLAKDHSGPLKPSIERIEGSVTKIVRPIHRAVYCKNMEILVFLDGKVDDVARFLDGVLPPTVKELGWKAFDTTKSTLNEVQTHGICSTMKVYFDKYEPVLESYGIQAYRKALTFPLVPQAVACSRYAAVHVNSVIITLKQIGLPLVSYLPLLPVNYFDKIARSE